MCLRTLKLAVSAVRGMAGGGNAEKERYERGEGDVRARRNEGRARRERRESMGEIHPDIRKGPGTAMTIDDAGDAVDAKRVTRKQSQTDALAPC